MILTLTVNPALDIYTQTPELFPGEKLRCKSASRDPGGGGVNVSRVIKRLGGSSTALYTKGGHTGLLFQRLLEQEGIIQDIVEIRGETRQNFAVTETISGDLFRFGFPGPEISGPEADQILDALDKHRPSYLVASGSLAPGLPPDYYAQVARRAKRNSARFVLDTSGKAFAPALEEGVFLLKPNQKELEDLTGNKTNDDDEIPELLLDVLDSYKVDVLVLSRGAKGAILATKKQVEHFKAPVVEHLSSVGAGDSMVAGIVHALSGGSTLDKAVRYGISCGSATIKSPGTELLQKKHVDRLYEQLLEMKDI